LGDEVTNLDAFRPPSGNEVTTEASSVEAWVPRYRTRAIACAYFMVFFTTAFVRHNELRFLAATAMASFIALACTLDARMHGKLFLRSFAWAMMFTWPIGLLVHLVWTRGSSGVGLYLVSALACIVPGALGMLVAGLLRMP
jgi:hypothetical protein